MRFLFQACSILVMVLVLMACIDQSSGRSSLKEAPFSQYDRPLVFIVSLPPDDEEESSVEKEYGPSIGDPVELLLIVFDWKQGKIVNKTPLGKRPRLRPWHLVFSPPTGKYYGIAEEQGSGYGEIVELDPKTSKLTTSFKLITLPGIEDTTVKVSPLLHNVVTHNGLLFLEISGKNDKIYLYDTVNAKLLNGVWESGKGTLRPQIDSVINTDQQDRFIFKNYQENHGAIFRLDPNRRELQTLYVHKHSNEKEYTHYLGTFQEKILVSIPSESKEFRSPGPKVSSLLVIDSKKGKLEHTFQEKSAFLHGQFDYAFEYKGTIYLIYTEVISIEPDRQHNNRFFILDLDKQKLSSNGWQNNFVNGTPFPRENKLFFLYPHSSLKTAEISGIEWDMDQGKIIQEISIPIKKDH